jgi:hypothetical protein
MTLVTTPPARERLHKIVKISKASPNPQLLVTQPKLGYRPIDRLTRNQIIALSEVNFVAADASFSNDRYLITFKLRNQFSHYFVLLNGLLEFSRPKSFKVSKNRTDKTFRLEFSDDETDVFVSYLETILEWLIKEINFRQALTALITFEKKMKEEQAILNSRLQYSLV